jgi:hypothetical protein
MAASRRSTRDAVIKIVLIHHGFKQSLGSGVECVYRVAMSELGQSRHFDSAPRTSALLLSADIADRVRQVRKVPQPEFALCATGHLGNDISRLRQLSVPSIGSATDRVRFGRPKTEAEIGRCRSLPEEQILDERGSAQYEHNQSKQKK